MDSKKIAILGKFLFLLILLFWTYQIFSSSFQNQSHWIFLDYANLAFHEGGHIIFYFFGDFLQFLGGSLFQILVPVFITFYFLKRHQWFSAFFGIFWTGESIINVSYYIKDARTQELPLIGGDNSIHDWNWILTSLNLLQYDTLLGNILFSFGILLIIGGLILMMVSILKVIQS